MSWEGATRVTETRSPATPQRRLETKWSSCAWDPGDSSLGNPSQQVTGRALLLAGPWEHHSKLDSGGHYPPAADSTAARWLLSKRDLLRS